jgi:hypothetical protein
MQYDQLFPRCCPVQTTDRFTKFQRLPPEIRNMIWEFALPEARVYEVLDAPNSRQKTPPHEGLMFANVHPEPPPALAAVCRESRSLVLHHYKPLTLGKTTKFVDMSRDILLLEPYLLVKRLHRTLHFMSQIPLVRDNATRLALGTSYGIYPGIFHPVLGRKVSKNNMGKLLASLAKFPRLGTLVFVVHQEFQFEFDFRFPGTLTPMPPVAAPGFGIAAGSAAAAGYPSPASSNGLLSNSAPPHHQTTTTPPATTGGLPSPGSSTAPSPSPPPLLPLPLPPLQQQQQQQHSSPPPAPPLPPGYQLHQPQQSPATQPQPQLQPHATLQAIPMPVSVPVPAPAQRPQQVHQAYRFKFDIEANINSPPRRPHTNELLYYPLDVRGEGDEFDEYERYVSSHASKPNSGYGAAYGAAYGSSAYGSAGAGNGNGYGSGSGYGSTSRLFGVGSESKLWECSLAGAGGGDGSDGEDGEGGEWCDPWPTNDDWRRFRRRWVRGMVAACLPPASSASSSSAGGDGDGSEWGGVEESRGGAAGGKGCGSWGGKGEKGKGARERVCLPRWRLKGASLLWRYTRGVGGVQ